MSALTISMPTKFPDVPAALAFNVISPSTAARLEPLVMAMLWPAVRLIDPVPVFVTDPPDATVTVSLASMMTGPPAELMGALTVIVSGGSMSRPPAPTLIAALISTAPPVELTLIAFSAFAPPTTPLNVVLLPALIVRSVVAAPEIVLNAKLAPARIVSPPNTTAPS